MVGGKMKTAKQTACGIFLKDGKILLGKRFDNDEHYAGYWDIPSGHVEKNETIEDALKREMMEELGVKVTKFEKAFVIEEKDPTSGNDYKHNCFYIISWKGKIINTGEAEKIGWFNLEETGKMKTTLPEKYLKKCFMGRLKK